MQTAASKKGEPGSTSGAVRVCGETNRQMCRRLLAAVQQWISFEMNPNCCVFCHSVGFRCKYSHWVSEGEVGDSWDLTDSIQSCCFFPVLLKKRTFSKPVEYFNSDSTGSEADTSLDLVFSRQFGNLVLFVLSSLIERSPQENKQRVEKMSFINIKKIIKKNNKKQADWDCQFF